MKKLLLTLSLLLLGAGAFCFAQTETEGTPIPQANLTYQPVEPVIVPATQVARPFESNYGLYELRSSLDLENLLLDRRKTALWLTVGGFIGTQVGNLFRDENENITEGGAIIVITGGLTMLTGAVWLVANEFKLIRVQKKINEKMLLSISPHGLKLNF